MRKAFVWAGVLALFAVETATAAVVAVDRVQQRYPWNGLVDIDYTIAGVEGDGCNYRLALSCSATVGGVAVTRPLTNFTVYAACDLPTSNGTWRVTWDANADGLSFQAEDLKIAANLYQVSGLSLENAAYVVIDLSSGAKKANGAKGTAYPVRYIAPGLATAATFNKRLYKTDRLVLQRVAGGTFQMGDTSWVQSKPIHEVTLSDYFLGIFEVTATQYLRVMAQVGQVKSGIMEGNPVDERPEESIATPDMCMYSWVKGSTANDGFSKLLNEKALYCGAAIVDGETTTFTLPTEAQWEYACRAGTTTKYFWGTDANLLARYAWTSENSAGNPHAVGSLKPNDWGFYDMIGNVSEIVADWWASGYSADAVTDPTGPATGTKKIFRGGNWHVTLADGAYGGACGFRNSNAVLAPTEANACGSGGCIGFRIAIRLK